MNYNNGFPTVKVGGKTYPAATTAPKCKTCASRYRLQVERALVEGYSPSQVLGQLPEGHGLLERNLRDHLAAGHLPVKAAAIQKLADEHQQERARVLDAGAEVLTSHAAFARTIVGRVRDRVANGELAGQSDRDPAGMMRRVSFEQRRRDRA